jgi:hypothetical protein
MGRFFLTYAADDGSRHGQAARYTLADDGRSLDIGLLLPDRPDPAADAWSWCSFTLALPDIVVTELTRDGRLQAPDLRQLADGRWVLRFGSRSIRWDRHERRVFATTGTDR